MHTEAPRKQAAGSRATDTIVRRILHGYSFFDAGTDQLREDLVRAAVLLQPKDGQVLLEAGRPCGDVLLVGNGNLRVFIAGESGREVTLYNVRGGETCPVSLSAAMLGVSAFANATASDGLEALSIPADKFRAISSKHAELRDSVFAATVSRFGEVIALIREITTRRVEHRLVDYLIRGFGRSDQDPPVIFETQQKIALDLGTVREVVSRRLQDLEMLGAVRLGRRRIILSDRVALFQVADAAE